MSLDDIYQTMKADSSGHLNSYIMSKILFDKYKNNTETLNYLSEYILPNETGMLVKQLAYSEKYDLCNKKKYKIAEQKLNNVMSTHLAQIYNKPTSEICKYIVRVVILFKKKMYNHFFTEEENEKFYKREKTEKTSENIVTKEYQCRCVKNIIISYFRIIGIIFKFNPEIIVNAFIHNLKIKKNKFDVIKKYYNFINTIFTKNINNFKECIIEKYDKYREYFLEQSKLPKPREIKKIEELDGYNIDSEYGKKFEHIPMYYEKCVTHIRLLNKMINTQQIEMAKRCNVMKGIKWSDDTSHEIQQPPPSVEKSPEKTKEQKLEEQEKLKEQEEERKKKHKKQEEERKKKLKKQEEERKKEEKEEDQDKKLQTKSILDTNKNIIKTNITSIQNEINNLEHGTDKRETIRKIIKLERNIKNIYHKLHNIQNKYKPNNILYQIYDGAKVCIRLANNDIVDGKNAIQNYKDGSTLDSRIYAQIIEMKRSSMNELNKLLDDIKKIVPNVPKKYILRNKFFLNMNEYATTLKNILKSLPKITKNQDMDQKQFYNGYKKITKLCEKIDKDKIKNEYCKNNQNSSECNICCEIVKIALNIYKCYKQLYKVKIKNRIIKHADLQPIRIIMKKCYDKIKEIKKKLIKNKLVQL
jgi:hypothetical protein